jgi:hypothetical protein
VSLLLRQVNIMMHRDSGWQPEQPRRQRRIGVGFEVLAVMAATAICIMSTFVAAANTPPVACLSGYYYDEAGASCSMCPTTTPFSDGLGTASSSCYSACPDASWTPWLDTGGVEGAHSCFKRVLIFSSFDTAQASCAAIGTSGRIHLLTSRQVRCHW